MDPPPDTDKVTPIASNDNSCWLATAANLLAGAGYGNGTTVQARAKEIYDQLVIQFTKPPGGWTDTAITWWLTSTNNKWTKNPYTIVTVYGNKTPKYPWADQNGARFIANELRRCQFVGLSISWPTDQVIGGVPVIGSGGHAITCWGDEGPNSNLSANPTQLRVTDSDNDTGGNVQTYTYDQYTNPNPGNPNEGNGWYFNYDPNHPYIKHICTLCPTDDLSDNKLTQKVVGSYKIHQSKLLKKGATDLHYEVGTDVAILSYKTTINWPVKNPPKIEEVLTTINGKQTRTKLKVDWDLTESPVPFCKWVTITTEFILPTWNSLNYTNVKFTYPQPFIILPDLYFVVKTPILEKPESIPNVTGGYLVGSFEIINPKLVAEKSVIAEFRFVHQYSYNQSPEKHAISIRGLKGYQIRNLRFGHSYGYLIGEELWKFEAWKTRMPEKTIDLDRGIELNLDWKGELPYPQGEDIKGRIKQVKRSYEVGYAKTVAEATKFIQAGYEFITEIDGVKVFRKKVE